MANIEHVAKLKEGVEAWNSWRQQNPKIRPDLYRLDLTTAEWKDTTLWDEKRQALCLFVPHARSVDEYNSVDQYIKFTAEHTKHIEAINFANANLESSNFTNCRLWKVNFRGASMMWSNLVRARCSRADFTDADLGNADLSTADFWAVNLTGARLSGANFTGTGLKAVIYNRKKMIDRCLGVRSPEQCWGNSLFRRDLQDQDIIDTLRKGWRTPW